MNSKFRIKLFFIMITFAIVLLFTVAFIDYKRLKEETVKNHEFQLTRTEESIEYALQTIDKAYYLFDQDTVDLLEQYTLELMERYSVEPDFSEWDFQSLAKKYEADIFIIDEENVIVHSNKEDEIGLDFSKCCKTLETILNERRASGGFHVDGMDVEQSSGDVRRYSYMATEDKKYIIELGYSLQDKAIFEQYNFLSVIDDLVEQYPTIKDIKILNLGGLSFGEETRALTDKRREAFEWTRTSRQTTEIQGEEEFITYRYVHYDTTLEPGITQNKVLEITYDEKDYQTLLNKHKNTFIAQLLIVLIVTVIISFIISRWMAKPIYMAFHDSLTKLKNRAAFDEQLNKKDLQTKPTTALLMLDIDNFKLVNDCYGHDQGDQLLINVASKFKQTLKEDEVAFRIGGDEFAAIIPDASKRETREKAIHMIAELQQMIANMDGLEALNVGVSVGIAFAPEHGEDPRHLYKAADLALYESKKSGKNQYHIYDPKMQQAYVEQMLEQ